MLIQTNVFYFILKRDKC